MWNQQTWYKGEVAYYVRIVYFPPVSKWWPPVCGYFSQLRPKALTDSHEMRYLYTTEYHFSTSFTLTEVGKQIELIVVVRLLEIRK